MVINYGLTFYVPCPRISFHHVIDFEQRMYKITGSSSIDRLRPRVFEKSPGVASEEDETIQK